MNYLQLVQRALKRAGVRNQEPTTLDGAIDIVSDMKDWVADAWYELQEESENWYFMQRLDQTFPILTGVDTFDHTDGGDNSSLNFRTMSIYTDAKRDETPLTEMDYEYWRSVKDTVESQAGLPTHVIERPDGVLHIWPVPDRDYTLRADAIWELDELDLDTDVPGFNRSGTTTLPSRYHMILVWAAVAKYAEQYEDGPLLEKAQKNFRRIHNRLEERGAPQVFVPFGRLTGYKRNPRVPTRYRGQ